jgi:hypothetical protein
LFHNDTKMSLTTLKDDLLQEFREERTMINDQIELLDPLATSLRRPAAQRLISASTLVLVELVCYVVSVGGIAFVAFMHRIYPFSLLSQIFYNVQDRNHIGSLNVTYLTLAVYGIAIFCAILVFLIARMAREIRLKNEILYVAGKNIKTIVGQHLNRKALMDTIEQRHYLGAPSITEPTKVKVNEVLNPGYDNQ